MLNGGRDGLAAGDEDENENERDEVRRGVDIEDVRSTDEWNQRPREGRAEERGVAEAIARSTDTCLSLGVPNVAIITGEGMSGGAIAITTANKVLMFEHAIYSVISPEAASSILWRDGTKAQEVANGMKITAQDMLRFGVIDQILKEPSGGAHRDSAAMISATGDAIAEAFNDVRNLDADGVRRQRRQKFLDIGRKLG